MSATRPLSIGAPPADIVNAGFQPGRAWAMTLLLFIFICINTADKVVLGLVAVPMMEEMGFTPTQFGLLGGSLFWLFAVSGIVGGFLADRFQARWLILIMAAMWALVQLPMAYGASLAAFVAARVLLGIGEGPAWPIAVHATYKWFPDSKRNLPVAVLAQGSVVGMLLAGLTIPQVTARWGWRAAFIGLGLLGLAWGVMWLLAGREGPLASKTQDEAGASKANELALKRVLADRTVWGNFVLHFIAYWTLACTLTWLPAYFQKGLGFDGVRSGQIFGIVVAITLPVLRVGSWWSQRLLARGWSSRAARGRFACLTLLLSGAFFIALIMPNLQANVRITIIALALGLTPVIYTLGPAMLAQVAPAKRRGAVIAIDNSIASLAGVIAPPVFGALIQANPGAHGFELGFLVTGVLLVAGAIIGWLTVDPERSAKRLYAN
ncbi:MAG: MFS transporter [Burkholderiaceae bacterium]